MAQSVSDSVVHFLHDSGLVESISDAKLTPLRGGIASDIWKVETSDRVFAVKKALRQLRTTQLWSAPVSRNASEAEWLITAARAAPGSVPQVLAHDLEAGIFAMTYFDPKGYPVWKEELHAGRGSPSFASQVGQTIATIHAATAGSAEISRRFANDDTFHSIRIEPYLEATARCHTDLAEPLLRLAHDTLSSKCALVHGDVSPKNILVGPHGPVFLDAECAWFGEPAFDLAFCLSHLLLKCVWTPSARQTFFASFDAVAGSYLATIQWEPPDVLEARAARLLPALLLARIDGKSPVEYIEAITDKDRVRRITRPLITSPPLKLATIKQLWAEEISE